MSADDSKKGGRPSPKEYRRVRDPKPEGDEKPATKENEVRVVASRGQRMYIKYAIEVFNGTEGKTKSDKLVLSGMGNAVYNVVNVVEILKRRIKGLHQTTEISSETMVDKYEAIDKEKEGLEVERKVSVIEVVLSTTALDTNHSGYQAPLPESEVSEQDDRVDEPRERRPRKRTEGKKTEKKGGRGEKKEATKDDKKTEKKDDKKGGRAPRREGDSRPARGGRGRGGDRDERPRRSDNRDDRAPTRGGRGGRRDDNDRRPRRNEDRDDERRPRRNDDRDDRAPTRGGRGERGGRGGSYSEGTRGSRGGRGSRN